MYKDGHYVGQIEQVMAYLDGELPSERAAQAATHLEECEDCQQLAAEMRGVSEELKAWEVEPATQPLAPDVLAALAEHEHKREPQKEAGVLAWRRHAGLLRRPWVIAGGLAATAAAVLFFSSLTLSHSKHDASEAAPAQENPGLRLSQAAQAPSPQAGPRPPAAPLAQRQEDHSESLRARIASDSVRLDGGDRDKLSANSFAAATAVPPAQMSVAIPNAPMIARVAELTLVVQDFDAARRGVDELLTRHAGYIGEMSAAAPEQQERVLTAKLRIPAGEVDATLSGLKKLGRVEAESQSGEEVTSQAVDLDARLTNARNSEKRLADLLNSRTGKLDDVLAVEQKISETREEIERMEAERKSLQRRVDFATITVTLKQEHKAQLQLAPPSMGMRFHNAAVDGFTTLVGGLTTMIEFLLAVGPSLLLWAAMLFFPVRWACRRTHREDTPTA